MSEQQIKRGSRIWYLLPIFFGFAGGMAMFFVLKEEDRQLAKNGVGGIQNRFDLINSLILMANL